MSSLFCLSEKYNNPTVFTVPSIGALALLLRSSCVYKKAHNTRQRPTKKNKRTEIRSEIITEMRVGTETCIKKEHRGDKGHTVSWKQTSIIKQEPQFRWGANYNLGP